MEKPTRHINAFLNNLNALLDISLDKNALDETLIYALKLYGLTE